jgi:hypothetical protein
VFAVIRETIAKMNMVAIGRVVLTRREHIIALEARGRGLLGLTLRYPYEVRDEKPYFEDIPEMKTPKDMLDLATVNDPLSAWASRAHRSLKFCEIQANMLAGASKSANSDKAA